MKLTTELIINNRVDAVWEIVGNQFSSAYKWASILNHSEGSGTKINDLVCDTRTCDIQGMGRTSEKLLEFEPSKYTLTYEAIKGMPFFISKGVNQWQLFPEGERTRVISSAEFQTRGIIGFLMRPMLKRQMKGIIQRVIEDLKFYVENGYPHPRKKKII